MKGKRLRCRGCSEQGWLGVRLGIDGPLFHERSVAPGEREIIPCAFDLKHKKGAK